MYDQNQPPRLLEIPQEILNDEILPRLPVKSISRFMCVSKSWRSVIQSDRFKKIHYFNSAKNPRVVFGSLFFSMKECSLQSLLNSKDGSDPTNKEAMSGTLVGCCNGVVCCYNYGHGRFLLWNPATRVRIELPCCGGRDLGKRGFGWDETSGAYKVFVVCTNGIGRLYSSKTKSWTTIPSGSSSFGNGVFLRGNLHWVDHGNSQIECFDLGKEEFGRIELHPIAPNDGFHYQWSCLREIGGCLGILHDTNKQRLDVWVMKEYGVKDSWFKRLTFHLPAALSPDSVPTRSSVFVPFFGEGPNGEVFVVYGTNLMVYSPKDDAFTEAANNVSFIAAHVYVESFISPERILDS